MDNLPAFFKADLLQSADVCNNCLQICRVEREKPPEKKQSRNPNTGELRDLMPQRWARSQEMTSLEYLPTPRVRDSKHIFCECGARGSHERIRNEWVPRDRFLELLKSAIRTIEYKGTSLSREHAIRRALALAHDDEGFVGPAYTADEAIARGIAHGRDMALVSTSSPSSSGTSVARQPKAAD